MKNENNSYRIRTNVGVDTPNKLDVKLNQTFEFLNILSLKIEQTNLYKMPASSVGVVCGRVLANGGFGVPNARLSIFIPKENGTTFNIKDEVLYNYSSTGSVNMEGVRYNLLPSYVDNECHQNVGTMYEKEYVLDNNDIIRVFDKYYTYTTRTNNAGDYFIYGIPVGQHTLHLDVDLSDIGELSIRPYDMIYKGYNPNQFESPNKFKTDKNLNNLPQIFTQDKSVYIYPFWGDTSDDDTNASITRCDIQIDYKFEPTAIFMGSIISDTGSSSISHKCVPDDKTGKMADLITGEGRIEMIRKTFDGRVEQFSVKGNRLIDGDGVWCYQVPMNLDYVTTDEFGNTVPTDNPDRGIPTRARVRFRISMDEPGTDDTAMKRARFLVPNNPRLTDDYPDFKEKHEADYEFGSYTKEESYRDLFWNNVYTVKSYVPRLQKRLSLNSKKHTGIKMVNHFGENNPMPYNNLSIRMSFVYRFLCVLMTIFIYLIGALNSVLSLIGWLFILLGGLFKKLCDLYIGFNILGKKIGVSPFGFCCPIACTLYEVAAKMVIKLQGSQFCDDGNGEVTYIPCWPAGSMEAYIDSIKDACKGKLKNCMDAEVCTLFNVAETDTDRLLNCVQNELAQGQEVTSFNFQDDWVNGVLYAPLWFRRIKPRRKVFFGLITIGGTDRWCDGSSTKMASSGSIFLSKNNRGLKLCNTCVPQRGVEDSGKRLKPLTLRPVSYKKLGVVNFSSYKDANCYGYKCHKRSVSYIKVDKGLVIRKETKYGEYVYYYKSVEYDGKHLQNILTNSVSDGEIKLLFATDIVLLGSLKECDARGIPQFFKHLTGTTYNMPPDLMSIDWDSDESGPQTPGFVQSDSEISDTEMTNVRTEYSGADWGNVGYDQWYEKDTGFFSAEGNWVKDGDNEHDNGGLFYSLNCNFSYVKPKSCINLHRNCEFGVTLDQSVLFMDSENDGNEMPPDGFISYDELYNADARSMFATMNGNNLRTKTDKKSGFPVYDFNYLYTENFDGSLYNLMKEVATKKPSVTYSPNYNLERNSDAYVRFRYGYTSNYGDFKIGFYNSNIAQSSIDGQNTYRFPRYENSFYFYFGLKPGKTAIDKFRSTFYAECTNDSDGEATVRLDYTPNGWCNDSEPNFRDGWVSFDFSNLDFPIAIKFDEKTRGSENDMVIENINLYKVYIGKPNTDLNDKGFKRICHDGIQENSYQETNDFLTLRNGFYTITIIDGNGNEYKQSISFKGETITFSNSVTSFTVDESQLLTQYGSPLGIAESNVVLNNTYRRSIGGYITVKDIMNNDQPMTDNFVLTITPVNDDESSDYHGCEYKIKNGIPLFTPNTIFNDVSNIRNGLVFGVGKVDAYYDITITQFCPVTNTLCDNISRSRVFVSKPVPFKMFINGVDYDLIKGFTTGYITQNNNTGLTITSPYNGYSETSGISTEHVKGWLDIDKIGVTQYVTTDMNYPQLLPSITDLSSSVGTPYNFSGEYIFDEDKFEMDIQTFQEVPSYDSFTGNPPVYIRVFDVDQDDPFGGVYHIYELDMTTQTYRQKFVGGQLTETLTLEEYYNGCGDSAKEDVVYALNSVIEERLSLVELMKSAFWLHNEDGKTVTITFKTNEKPVNTMAYYIADTSIDTGGVVMTTISRDYSELDSNREENTFVGIVNPTITQNSDETKTIFKTVDGVRIGSKIYKKPFYCAIKNGVNVTIPQIFGNGNTGFGATGTLADMRNMFGFHIIDKRFRFVGNVWEPITNWPMYMPHVTGDGDYNNGDFFNMHGFVAGFVYNGFSTSQTRVAKFVTQRLNSEIKIYTMTVNDGTETPNEYAVPTKRFIYSETPETVDCNCYTDYHLPGAPISDVQGEDITQHYTPLTYSDSSLLINDENESLIVDMKTDIRIGIPEDTVVGSDVSLGQVCDNMGDGTPFTFYKRFNSQNPIYQKVYNNSGSIPSDSASVNMTYNATHTVSNLFVHKPNTVYYVGVSNDGMYRAVSPTYEISSVNTRVEEDIATHKIKVTVRYSNDNTDYYLKYYNHQIVFSGDRPVYEIQTGVLPEGADYVIVGTENELKTAVDQQRPYIGVLSTATFNQITYKGNTFTKDVFYRLEEVIENETVSDILPPAYDDLPPVSGYKYETYVSSIDWDERELYAIYLKDITGIRRTIVEYE